MASFISFHSLKGGTGKTTLAANLAALSALNGRKVCLLDFDFRAPSLHVFFKAHPDFWLNDFLNGKCDITDTLKVTDIRNGGRLVVGFANPSTEVMRDMMTKDREWEADALKRILSAKATIRNEGYDLVILDTSPGIQYSSFNALAASNLVVLVMNRDELYRDDVTDLLNRVYRPLGRRIGIALNKVLFCASEEKTEKSRETNRKSNELKKNVEEKFGCRVLALIPCFCDVLVGGYEVYALNRPKHPFTVEMLALSGNIWNDVKE